VTNDDDKPILDDDGVRNDDNDDEVKGLCSATLLPALIKL